MARPKTYSINETYFNSVDDHTKAYILGFLYADGNVGAKNYCIAIKLSRKDREVLEFIRKSIGYTGPIIDYLSNEHEYSSLSFNSETMRADLIRLGIIPNKTYKSTQLPTCKLEFYHSMMLGLFDGDGSIWTLTNKKRGCKEYAICFSGNDSTLMEIKEWLNYNSISSGTIRYRYGVARRCSCMLDIKGRLNIERLYELLYKDCDFRLSRKYNRFLEFIEHNKTIEKKYTTTQRDEILVMYNEGKSQCDISRALNLPASSVRGVVQRGRRDGLTTKSG